MDSNLILHVFSYLQDYDRRSFTLINRYYFNWIYKAELRTIKLRKQSNLIYYLIYQDFRYHVERLITSPIKQLSFSGCFNVKGQPIFPVIEAVIDAVKKNRYLPHAWEGFALPPPSLPLRDFTVTLPEARSLQFCSIITTDLIFVRFLQPALKKVTHLSISSDYSSSQRFLTEIFSFLEREGDSLDLHSLTLTGFSDCIYTLPYISTLKELIIKHSSIIFDSKYEDTNHEFNSIVCVDNKEMREFKLSNVCSLKLENVYLEDIRLIQKIEDVNISCCIKIKYFPAVFPRSKNMILFGRKLYVDVTTTSILSLFCDGFEKLDSSFLPKSPKQLRKLCITGQSTSGKPESIFLDESSIVCCNRDHYGIVCNSKILKINHFQLSSIIRIPLLQQFYERRYVHIFSPEGEQHMNFLKDIPNISINICFEKFCGER